jgi:hypothetical protein
VAVLLYTNMPIALCENGVIVCPICTQLKMMTNYPITEFRKTDVIAYGHMMGVIEENGVDKGQLIFSNSNTDEPILWFPMHKLYNTRYKLDWIESGLETIAKYRFHDKYRIYFPAIGYYEEDGLVQEDVLELVQKHLSDGKEDVIFVTHY